MGQEFGATTGRARRCGWFDAAILHRAVVLNSLSGICLTKLDVLDDLEEINICTGYEVKEGDVLGASDATAYDNITPIYETMPGWQSSTIGITQFDDLPENAKKYIKRIEEIIECPIDIISTGPDRSQTIVLRDPYDA